MQNEKVKKAEIRKTKNEIKNFIWQSFLIKYNFD